MKTFTLVGLCLTLGAGVGAGSMYLLRHPQSASPTGNATAPIAAEVPQPAPATPPLAERPRPSDADKALTGVRRGDMLPLDEILAKVRSRFPGEVLGVELTEDDGVAEYEIKILSTGGRVLEIEVDPRTGGVLSVDEDD
ncbi:PepSY domain-containing protein [Terrihabitans rhizophilus]|uniref:PepSY domain-containing protein n=1 Tax=Terrihabitans rhizophilus TaxID=3092662 RepID=A0ABU4RN70_9HYPH|nr:PepSY domain-containing protein [Terrihabitans sp. PJ23]MDX6806273.1 PepSY domain-containing protein [Terrihabitans sp. PJ23]